MKNNGSQQQGHTSPNNPTGQASTAAPISLLFNVKPVHRRVHKFTLTVHKEIETKTNLPDIINIPKVLNFDK